VFNCNECHALIADHGPRCAAGDLVQRRWSWPGQNGKPVYNFRSEAAIRPLAAGRLGSEQVAGLAQKYYQSLIVQTPTVHVGCAIKIGTRAVHGGRRYWHVVAIDGVTAGRRTKSRPRDWRDILERWLESLEPMRAQRTDYPLRSGKQVASSTGASRRL
jgi:hypothetical protein